MPHIPVLYKECIEGLQIKPDGVYLDMTVGGFGHGRGICEKLGKNGVYIGLDLDIEAIERARAGSEGLKNKIFLLQCHFADFSKKLDGLEIENIDGCLIDLGVSSFQIDEANRGFSFTHDGPLDMRMDQNAHLTCESVVNEYSEKRLADLIFKYSDERFSRSIARAIVKRRGSSPIKTTFELAETVKSGIPKKFWYTGKNPATKTFQALRIEVNDELSRLFDTLCDVIDRLKSGGRIAVISFHSLEDRAVKEAFKFKSRGCTCPKDLPVCVCGNKPSVKIIAPSPILPGEEELAVNVRSRSAKLRIAEKLT